MKEIGLSPNLTLRGDFLIDREAWTTMSAGARTQNPQRLSHNVRIHKDSGKAPEWMTPGCRRAPTKPEAHSALPSGRRCTILRAWILKNLGMAIGIYRSTR